MIDPITPGELTVHVAPDATGRTRATCLRQRYPQRVTAPLHSDPDHPHAAVLCVQSPSGGTFSDDALHTTVECAPGAHLQLTTQAATQVFAGDGPGTRHRLRFTVCSDAVLEYRPKTVIPHANSRFTQILELVVEPGGTYLGWEAVAAGRIAHGERFLYTSYDTTLTVQTGGRIVARDRQIIRPEPDGRGTHLLDGDYVATLVAVAPGRPPEPALQRGRRVFDGLPDVRGGIGVLPLQAGVVARLTAARAPELHHALHALCDAVRAELLAPDLRFRRSA